MKFRELALRYLKLNKWVRYLIHIPFSFVTTLLAVLIIYQELNFKHIILIGIFSIIGSAVSVFSPAQLRYISKLDK